MRHKKRSPAIIERPSRKIEKKILIVLGSPRKKGNSATLAYRLCEGAQEKGACVEILYLNSMSIKPCQGCGQCQKEESNDCVIKDEMHSIYPKLREADSIVIASPVYWFNMSSQTKLFLDRCYAVGVGSKNILSGKQVAILLAYADPDPFVSGAVNVLRSFQDICRYVGANLIGMVYGSANKAGELKDNLIVMDQAYKLGQQLA